MEQFIELFMEYIDVVILFVLLIQFFVIVRLSSKMKKFEITAKQLDTELWRFNEKRVH